MGREVRAKGKSKVKRQKSKVVAPLTLCTGEDLLFERTVQAAGELLPFDFCLLTFDLLLSYLGSWTFRKPSLQWKTSP